MHVVAKQQLQSVTTGCERQYRLGLTAAEMAMLGIVRNHLTGFRWCFDIDQQMMMPGVRMRDASWGDAHAM